MDVIQKFAQDVKTKVLNLKRTPLEKLLHEATSNDNWGANPKIFRQISDLSYHFENRETILNFIYHRLSNKNKNWRKILKTLELIEYLLKNGLQELCIEFRREIVHITTHCDFQLIEKAIDRGLSIRSKANKIVQLLSDDSELQFEREQAKQLYQRSMNLQGFGSDQQQEMRQGDAHKKQYHSNSIYDKDDSANDHQKKRNHNHAEDYYRKNDKISSDFDIDNQNDYKEERDEDDEEEIEQKQESKAQSLQKNKLKSQEVGQIQQNSEQGQDFWKQQWGWGFTANPNKGDIEVPQKQFWNQDGFNENPQAIQKLPDNKRQQQQQEQQKLQQQQQQQLSQQQQQQILQQEEKQLQNDYKKQQQKKAELEKQQQQIKQNQLKVQQQKAQQQQQKEKQAEFNLLDLDIVVPAQPNNVPTQIIPSNQQISHDIFSHQPLADKNTNQKVKEQNNKWDEEQYKNFSKEEKDLINLSEIKKENKKEENSQFVGSNFMQFQSYNANAQQGGNQQDKRDYSALNAFGAYQNQFNSQQQQYASIYSNQSAYYSQNGYVQGQTMFPNTQQQYYQYNQYQQ